jgi:hypothetical protein
MIRHVHHPLSHRHHTRLIFLAFHPGVTVMTFHHTPGIRLALSFPATQRHIGKV